jgi:hypothetical protein
VRESVAKPSVKEVCDKTLDESFKKWDGNAPKLGKFMPNPDTPLAGYLREDVDICSVPDDVENPELLLFGVTDDKHTKKPVYKHIEKTSKLGATALYGTSGAGKTRSIFEYLSHNRGLYFVADKTRNLGSRDLVLLLGERLRPKLTQLEKSKHPVETSELNKEVAAICVKVVVYVRQAVFKRVQHRLGRAPTPYEWLLLQLYPREFFGEDVFCDGTRACLSKANTASVYEELDYSLWDVCFVDEAQKLLVGLHGYFLSSDGVSSRSAFSALLTAFQAMAMERERGFPVFSGTGLSVDALEEESGSVVAKRPRKERYPLVFADLPPLNVGGVAMYLETFLKLRDVIGDDLLEHACKWLRGRPRWTATFVETALIRTNHPKRTTTRGRFNSEELPFIQILDRYVSVMTAGDNSQRDSWRLGLGKATAFAAVAKLRNKQGKADDFRWQDTKAEFDKAVFKFALGGDFVIFQQNASMLVEIG